MIIELLVAAIKRDLHCLWVDIRYLTPLGDPCWAVAVQAWPGHGNHELARARLRSVAVWRAWRRVRRTRTNRETPFAYCWCGLPRCAWSELHCPGHARKAEREAWPDHWSFARWCRQIGKDPIQHRSTFRSEYPERSS